MSFLTVASNHGMNASLRDFLGDATQQEQEVVLLRADGMTYLEIGAALELPPERVKTVIRSIRSRLARSGRFKLRNRTRRPGCVDPVTRKRRHEELQP
ncbi:MAG: hypothetical protein H0X73_07335 [Chthoniobacterales bacterium]|nr:hypothetical protein [Chthoniobacterales bacterium]